jgi:hypothetical protein
MAGHGSIAEMRPGVVLETETSSCDAISLPLLSNQAIPLSA